MAVPHTPAGYRTVNPYLIVRGAARAIEFYTQVLGARVRMRLDGPGGKIGHAELAVGDSVVMLADEVPEMGFVGPETIGGSPVCLGVYVQDVDQTFARALAAGARQLRPVADQFYGDRTGTLADPFGHVWSIATHKEDLSPEELQRRFDSLSKGAK